MADTRSAARAMWTMFEPVHDVTYFAPEALRAFTLAGLRGYWRGYFAGRAAPLGSARAAVVTASFYNFAPAFVARAVPGVWDLITPHEAIAVREAGAAASLRGLLARAGRPRRRRRQTCCGAQRRTWTSPGACCPRRTPSCRSPVTP